MSLVITYSSRTRFPHNLICISLWSIQRVPPNRTISVAILCNNRTQANVLLCCSIFSFYLSLFYSATSVSYLICFPSNCSSCGLAWCSHFYKSIMIRKLIKNVQAVLIHKLDLFILICPAKLYSLTAPQWLASNP